MLRRIHQLLPNFSGWAPGWLHALESTNGAAGTEELRHFSPTAYSNKVNPRQSSSYPCPDWRKLACTLDTEKASYSALGTDLVPLCPPESGKRKPRVTTRPQATSWTCVPLAPSTAVMLPVSLPWTGGTCRAEPDMHTSPHPEASAPSPLAQAGGSSC